MQHIIINIKDGKAVDSIKFFNELETLKDGKYYLKKRKRPRTNDQNAYYRALIAIIAKESEEEKDYIHESLRMKFLVDKTKRLPYAKSTTMLSTVEFANYIEEIKNFMAGFNINLPSAEERNNLIKD